MVNFFKNKKITLMGLGLLGRGVGDAIFLAEAGADLTVTDLKSEAELAESVSPLKKFKNVKLVLGRHELEDFRSADMVVKAAGVPQSSPFVAEAVKNNVPVVMSTALFVKLSGVQAIGITGTRGKSTVTDMVFEILQATILKSAPQNALGAPQLPNEPKIFLGGNVRGLSTLALLPEVKPTDIAVLELDSWQLQGFAGINGVAADGFSPHIAVFTTFMPDHLNYYAGDMERYFADKANIYRFQTADDFLIVSEQVVEFIKKFGPEPKSKMIVTPASDLSADFHLKIPGEHNRLNAALALATVKVCGELFLQVSEVEKVEIENVAREVLGSYKGLPGRLAFARKYNDIEIYNDTNSTTPDATIAALKAFGSGAANKKKTVLIFGGADKKLDPASLLKLLPDYAKALVVLPGTGTEIIRTELLKINSKYGLPVEFVSSMAEAVEKGLAMASPGDVLIMSPGFASFGLFKNEYDRGDQFDAIVKKL